MTYCARFAAATLLIAGLHPFGSACFAQQNPLPGDLKRNWKAAGGQMFHTALRSGPGFSFGYGGKKAVPGRGAEWRVSARTSDKRVDTAFQHPSGIVATRSVRSFPEYDAIEYRVVLRNTAAEVSAPVGPIFAMNLEFGSETVAETCVVAAGGGVYDSVYPPQAFALRKHCFGPMSPIGGVVTLTTTGGRSSNKDLPFFFVENARTREGLFVAFGWSGQWAADIVGDFNSGTLRLQGQIPDLRIHLKPGEEVPGPSILIGSYTGGLPSGSNRLRGLIRDHYTPRLAGKPFTPIATYDHWWNIDHRFTEPLLRKLADAASELGQEYFLLDAGWFAGSDDVHGFSAGVGNWEEIDRAKFPAGLSAFAGYVRDRGLKFGLWFEPERVASDSLLGRQHRDWVLWPGGKPGTAAPAGRNWGLLDYGRPEVQQWVRTLLDRYITELGIRYIRYDFNLDPLPYWTANDPADRKGLTQLRHIEGFYRVIDWIRERHPETVLEGCASGGRRIDLETARRFHTFWISDHTADPSFVREHLFGINHFLPGNYHYVCYTLPLAGQKDFHSSDAGFQSLFGGAFGTGGRIDQWPASMRQQARTHVSVYKTLREFLVQDFYPLTEQARDLQSWEAWQFHDPERDRGFVQAFRAHSPNAARHFNLKGLQSGAVYRFTDPYSGKSFELSGAAAGAEGVRVELAETASQVLMYRAVKSAAASAKTERGKRP